MMVMTKRAIMDIMVVLKPMRHAPRIPAIFCSCGVFPEPEVSLPIHAPRLRIRLVISTMSANKLKSRKDWISFGLMKLSPETRLISTGAISLFQDNSLKIKQVMITKIG